MAGWQWRESTASVSNEVQESNMGEDFISGFDIAKDYGLKFDVNGSSLSATLYDGADVVGSIIHTDDGTHGGAALTTGKVGFFANQQTAGLLVQGEWLNATIIPEPGAIAMLIAGSLALLGWARLRRRS